MSDPQHDAALAAVRDRIAKATVFIVDGGHRKMPHALGSGTLLRTPGDRLVVLTAKHLFERGGPAHEACRVCWYKSTDTLDPFQPSRCEHDGDVDVACLLVPPTHEGPMREYAVDASDVAGWYGRHSFDDSVFLTGYPEKLLDLKVDHARRRGTLGFTSIAYTANVKDLGRDALGRLTLDWREMVIDGDPTLHELPPPNGMSGGALWYFDPARLKDPVWEPSKFLRVIGVQSAWREPDRVAIIEGSDRWLDWFDVAIRRIDGA